MIVTPLKLMVKYLDGREPMTELEKEVLLMALYMENKIHATYGLANRALKELDARS